MTQHRVRHKIHGYLGYTDGTTRIKKLFECPADDEEIRVHLSNGDIEIASPSNLEYLEEVLADVDRCPRCGGALQKRKGKFGLFFGCSNYPKCAPSKNKRTEYINPKPHQNRPAPQPVDVRKVWVGVLEDGRHVVFDPLAQPPAVGERVLLWSSAVSEFSLYYKDAVKKHISPVTDRSIRDSIICQYREFIARKAEYEHMARLSELGITYTGISISKGIKTRTTHCYRCKDFLDSGIDRKCNNCGWILCRCGACGCGYDSGSF